MSFWDVLLRRPCPKQVAQKHTNVELEKAIAAHKEAIKQTEKQMVRTKRATTAVEVAAQALEILGRANNKNGTEQ